MISIKRYLNRTESEGTLQQQMISLLLEKIGSSAVVGDRLEYEAFQSNIDRMRGLICSDVTDETLLLTTGSATQALEAYNEGINRFLRKQATEMQGIVALMTETVVRIGGGNKHSAQHLQEIGDRLERAGAIQDLPALKAHLGECLHSFREEVLRQKSDTDSLIQSLQQQVDHRAGLPVKAPPAELDEVTGLPSSESGKRAIQQAINRGNPAYIVVMVVNRIQPINARFGREIGDRILRAFSVYVQSQVVPSDQLFRWQGPAVVALVQTAEPIEFVRMKFKRMMDARIEDTIESCGRSMQIRITAAWSIFRLLTTVAAAETQIQAFIELSHEQKKLS